MENKLQNILSFLNNEQEGNKKSNKSSLEENLKLFKEVKINFSSKFNDLVSQIEKIPEDLEETYNDEVSPASLVTVTHWEWLYHTNCNQPFQKDMDLYTTTGQYGNLLAYSSITIDSDTRLQVKFHDTTSFGCGGFGIISKNEPNFNNAAWVSNTHPVFCLCCTGTWGAQSIGKISGESMQNRLRNSVEKKIIFEFDFGTMKFNVYDPNDELFSVYDMNQLNHKDNLVLIFYSTSTVRHSHEIIPV